MDGGLGPGFINELQQDGGTCWGVGSQTESQGKSSSSIVTVYAAIKEGGGEGGKIKSSELELTAQHPRDVRVTGKVFIRTERGRPG